MLDFWKVLQQEIDLAWIVLGVACEEDSVVENNAVGWLGIFEGICSCGDMACAE